MKELSKLSIFLIACTIVFFISTIVFVSLYVYQLKENKKGTVKDFGEGNKRIRRVYLTPREKIIQQYQSKKKGLPTENFISGNSNESQSKGEYGIAFLKSMNANNHMTRNDVDNLMEKLSSLSVFLASKEDLLEENVRPLQSVFWYQDGTATKYGQGERQFKPSPWKTTTDIAIRYPKTNKTNETNKTNGFDWASYFSSNFQMFFIPADLSI